MKRLCKMLIATPLVLAAGAFWGCSTSSPNYFGEAPVPDGWPELTPVDEVRVNVYPAYRAAVITAEQGASDNGLFRPLFNHIKREDIAMTAPVEMTYNDQGQASSMAFVYRTADLGEVGADQADPRVQVIDIPGQYAVSVGVRGRYNADRFNAYRQQLVEWLDENADEWRAAGEARYLGYNSPFVPGPMRYGEVQIPIEPIER